MRQKKPKSRVLTIAFMLIRITQQNLPTFGDMSFHSWVDLVATAEHVMVPFKAKVISGFHSLAMTLRQTTRTSCRVKSHASISTIWKPASFSKNLLNRSTTEVARYLILTVGNSLFSNSGSNTALRESAMMTQSLFALTFHLKK